MADNTERNQSADNTSHDLDMVDLHHSHAANAIVADMIHAILESNGVYSIVSGTAYPQLGFEVKVRRADLPEAQRLVAEALASGPAAAEEAEAASERETPTG